MPIEKTTFANPPAFEVRAEVSFNNDLNIADDRSGFHRLIKQEFPFVVMPDLKQLPHDFGDYTLYSKDQMYRIEVSMNYFRLVTTRYSGFQEFQQMYLSALGMFTTYYKISIVNRFAMQYKNKLPLPKTEDFAEYFNVQIRIPESLNAELQTGRGVLAYKDADGLILLEFDPQFNGNAVESYGLNLTFGSDRLLTLSEGETGVSKILANAHHRLTDFFFSILKPDLIQYLKTL
jgi:uncharacterized protein (TIGR04255 family)